MSSGWGKGFTKETHPSIRKISETMKRRKIDNFAKWRLAAKAQGLIKSEYRPLERNGDLAELIGAILGDGHIACFPRTERLMIFSNSNNPGFIRRYARLVEGIFGKKPYVSKVTYSNCTRISIYEKTISRRLGVPTGARKYARIRVPRWILANKQYVVRYLRGLYEAEGSASVHLPTSTYKLSFANTNQSLLKIVSRLMRQLGFFVSMDAVRVQVSRKEHVERAIQLLEFRKY
jgi:DNA-binding transcriptional regulator WhiA